MTLRLSFFLLVFANLVFYAWANGHFGRIDADREPERLAAQLQPEKLRILGTQAPAPVPKPAELACRRVDGLAMLEAESLRTAAIRVGALAELLPQVEPTRYLLVISDLANDAVATRKVAELRRLGVAEMETAPLDDSRREIVLGRYPTEDEARDALAALNKRGVRSARIDARDLPPTGARVELRGPANLLPQVLPSLIAPFGSAVLADCAK